MFIHRDNANHLGPGTLAFLPLLAHVPAHENGTEANSSPCVSGQGEELEPG